MKIDATQAFVVYDDLMPCQPTHVYTERSEAETSRDELQAVFEQHKRQYQWMSRQHFVVGTIEDLVFAIRERTRQERDRRL
tara:strand:- start:719 stop:961 length:243 start_codon:yes stop_codon:yes gene_type:complete